MWPRIKVRKVLLVESNLNKIKVMLQQKKQKMAVRKNEDLCQKGNLILLLENPGIL